MNILLREIRKIPFDCSKEIGKALPPFSTLQLEGEKPYPLTAKSRERRIAINWSGSSWGPVFFHLSQQTSLERTCSRALLWNPLVSHQTPRSPLLFCQGQ